MPHLCPHHCPPGRGGRGLPALALAAVIIAAASSAAVSAVLLEAVVALAGTVIVGGGALVLAMRGYQRYFGLVYRAPRPLTYTVRAEVRKPARPPVKRVIRGELER